MSAYFTQKAENVLKRSDDLIQTNQTQIAFQELQQVVTNKKIKQWDERLEGVMKKYLDLCVELRKSQEAKTALIQYRTLCGASNVRSLDDVVGYFLDLAEKRAQKAQAESKIATLDLEKDLDGEIPESVLMSELSGEDIKDRTDREIVTPWLKFLWDAYRNVLELLKNHANMESRYHDAAQRAFKFCKQYKRKREFKNLSELLRTHLSNIQKYATMASTSPFNKITLTANETLQFFVETRFKQLSTASYLELWQEAYRSVEDLHRLLSLSKELPKPQLLINYYDHLTKIFWNSQNYVLHSYANYKLFNLIQQTPITKESKREKAAEKNIEDQVEPLDLKTIASSLLLSSISIPSTKTTHDEDIVDMDFGEIEKQQRLANLLDLSSLPDKSMILSQVISKRVLSLVLPELKDLYQILEVELNPLEICERMEKIFSFLETNQKLKVYIQPLKDVTLSKFITQLSKVYQTVHLSQVTSMVTFMTLPEIERAFVQAVRQRRLLMTIDHQNDCITFGNNKNGSALDTDSVRSQLSILAKRLYIVQSLTSLSSAGSSTTTSSGGSSTSGIENIQKPVLIKAANKKILEEEHKNLVNRKELIEKKKLWEAENKKRELEIIRKQEEELKKQREEEERKLVEKQLKERELAALKRKQDEERQLQLKKVADSVTAANIVTGPAVLVDVLESTNANVKEKEVKRMLDEKQKEILNAKKKREEKLSQKVTNLDVLERARRTEEIPLIKQFYETQQKTDRERYESQHRAQQDALKLKFEHDKKMKQQLSKMFKDRKHFINDLVLVQRKDKINDQKKEQEEKKRKLKQIWDDKRSKIQKEISRIQKEKEEEDAKRQEVIKAKREEEERKRKEADEQQRIKDKDEEDRRRRLDKVAEIQAQKQREIEEAENRKKKQLQDERMAEQLKKDQLKKETTTTSSNSSSSAKSTSRWGNIDPGFQSRPKPTENAWSRPSGRNTDDAPKPSDAPRTEDAPRRTEERPSTGGRFSNNDDAPRRRFDDDRDAPRRTDDRPSGRFNNDDRPSGRFSNNDDAPRRRFDDDRDAPRRTEERPSTGGRFTNNDDAPRRTEDRPSTGGRFGSDDAPRRTEERPSTGSRFGNDDAPRRRGDDDRDAPRRGGFGGGFNSNRGRGGSNNSSSTSEQKPSTGGRWKD